MVMGANNAVAQPETAQQTGDSMDVAGQTAQMQQMFQQSVAENQKITEITTEGNTAKRAASAQPQ
jgi:hypothetical protein